MPIAQDESGLTIGQYSDFEALRTGSTYRLTLQRMSFQWTTLGGSEDTQTFDVDVATDYILKAVLSGTTITVSGCISDGSWTTEDTISSVSSDVAPSLWADGDDVRVFYWDGTDIKYRVSSDGGYTWGAGATVGTLANVAWIAATGLHTLHVATFDDYNTRLHVYNYSGSWTKTDSSWYYPGQFGSFDAEPMGDYDVLAFDALGQVRYDTSRQGVWYVRHKDLVWGDPYEIDVLDEHTTGTDDRTAVMLSTIDGKVFATYGAVDASVGMMCYSRTASGRFWQHRQPMGSAILYKGKMVTLGDHTFFVCGDYIHRSASTPIVGNSTVEYDVSSRVTQYQANQAKAYQSRITLDNDDDGLVDLTGFTKWAITEEVGYFDDGGTALLVQRAITLVDTVSVGTGLPVSQVDLTSRDKMALLMDYTEADHYEEWESQLRHWDDFENIYDETLDKTILNSGMGYTATMEGYWETVENTEDDEFELRLTSNNKEGLALCTVDKFIGHTIDQQAIKVPTANNDEWAGIVFRALDEDNYWCAYYDQTTDTVKLRQKVSGVWQSAVATTGALSWSVNTWYYLRVEARLSLFTIYYSTDGRTWTQGIQYVDVTHGVAEGNLYAWAEGYVGYAGFGYSDEDIEPDEPPAYEPPDISIPTGTVYELYEQFIISKWGVGVAAALTNDVINATTPTWFGASGGLDANGKYIHEIMYTQANSLCYLATRSGIWSATLPLYSLSSWSNILTQAEIKAEVGNASATFASVTGLACSWSDPLTQWATVACGTYGNMPCYVFKTTDGWATIASSAALPYTALPASAYDIGGVAVDRSSSDQTIYVVAGYTTWGYGVYKSTDGGGSFTAIKYVEASSPHPIRVLNKSGEESTVFAVGGTSNKVYKSTDGGGNWSEDAAIASPNSLRIRQLQEKFYLISNEGIAEWSAVSDSWTTFYAQAYPTPRLQDGLCVGWGTNDALGYVIGVGDTPGSVAFIRRFDDYGNVVDIKNNLDTALPGGSTVYCIGAEGQEWEE